LTNERYPKNQTALLFIDPYNDFLSEGGKLWPMVEGVARSVGLLDNLRTITTTVRKLRIELNGPTFAHAILTTDALVAALAHH
jgi:nicotinamidase-related amidase